MATTLMKLERQSSTIGKRLLTMSKEPLRRKSRTRTTLTLSTQTHFATGRKTSTNNPRKLTKSSTSLRRASQATRSESYSTTLAASRARLEVRNSIKVRMEVNLAATLITRILHKI